MQPTHKHRTNVYTMPRLLEFFNNLSPTIPFHTTAHYSVLVVWNGIVGDRFDVNVVFDREVFCHLTSFQSMFMNMYKYHKVDGLTDGRTDRLQTAVDTNDNRIMTTRLYKSRV